MGYNFDYAKIHILIDADIEIAPIHTHIILEHLIPILKSIAELERSGTRKEVSTDISIKYIPVCPEDSPRVDNKCQT